MTEKFDNFNKIELKEEEHSIFSSLKRSHKQIQDDGKKAHNLYMKLTARGIKPRYDKYLYRNRIEDVGGGPELLQFHQDENAIEDLINFIECKSFNDEVDDTMGKTFVITTYNSSIKKNVTARLTRTKNGWNIEYWEKNEVDDKGCSKLLKHMASIDFIDYPNGIGFAFEKLWREADDGMEPSHLQKKLDEISKWICLCEMTKPNWL